MDWKHLLAYISGTIDQELLLRHEYLVTENRILRHQITGRVRLTDGERKTLAEIGQKLGRQALKEVATIVKPDTIFGWHRTFVAQKFDGSNQRKAPGRPKVDPELETLIVRMAQENRSWGYDRIVGALANLGYTVSDHTVGNILKRHGLVPAPERKTTTTWKEKMQSLDNTATRIMIPEGTSPTTMKNRILRIAAELRIPLTIRKVPGGLLFWRSTAEDLKQAQEVAQRFQPAQRKGRARPRRR